VLEIGPGTGNLT